MSDTLHPHLQPPRPCNTGIFARLRGWLERRHQHQSNFTASEADHGMCGRAPRALAANARVLPFPIRGEALLVGLADRLRQLVAGKVRSQDLLILSLSRTPHSRLTIDRDAYVEFNPAVSIYRAVLAAGGGTTITVDTSDFDTVVRFVVLYVTDRVSDAAPMEAAS